jgi:hypothetical protein
MKKNVNYIHQLWSLQKTQVLSTPVFGVVLTKQNDPTRRHFNSKTTLSEGGVV